MSALDRQPDASTVAKQKRLAAREKRVLAGVGELSRFLEDLLRQGLATASATGYRTWDEMASRMVDAQAPGLARMVRDLGGVAHAGPDWQDNLLERIGRLHLLLEAYRRIESLDDDLASDVRSLVGFATRRDAVLARPAVHDTWWVLGRRLELQDNLSTARCWLWGEQTGRFALVLSFAAGGQPFDIGPAPGTRIEADLHFYPSAVPLRATIASSARRGRANRERAPNLFRSLREAWDDYRRALVRLPWIERFPMTLRGVVPSPVDESWRLQDAEHAIAMQPFGRDGWTLLAVSGGHPVDVCGEWNGAAFVPFGCFSEGGFATLARNPLYSEIAP